MQDAAESVASSDVEAGDLAGIGERCGQRVQWSGVRDALVRRAPTISLNRPHIAYPKRTVLAGLVRALDVAG